MVGVDHEGPHPDRDQVIEDESDERLLENRDQRLGQIFGQRTQPHPKPGAENKSLGDHRLAVSVAVALWAMGGWPGHADTHASHSEAATEAIRAAVLVIPRDFDRTGPMTEETIWRGTASQLKNLGCFILCVLFCWLLVPIFIGLRRYLETKNQVYELTNERLKTSQGIFSKVTESLELYRVKDIEVLQPFIYRIVGLENIKVNTSDLSSPVILMDGISQKIGLADKLRNQVEIIRAQKKVRELDIE